MKSVRNKETFFKPGAPRWAFVFMGRTTDG